MKVLVLGGRGAVGRVVVDALRGRGHHVTSAGRSGTDGPAIDLSAPDVTARLRDVARGHDVLVNASGIERVDLADVPLPLVEISATGSYLSDLRERLDGAPAVLGAGLAPGLSTVLVRSLALGDGHDVDLGIQLGTGEQHGAAAVRWTAALIGTDLHAPPEQRPVRNLTQSLRLPGADGRTVRHLRADFPDHVLLGPDGPRVRSYLATTDALTTAALAMAGRAPWLRSAVTHAPHVGSDAWALVAVDRAGGSWRRLQGRGQSVATGILTALAVERTPALTSTATMADVSTLDDAVALLDGVVVTTG